MKTILRLTIVLVVIATAACAGYKPKLTDDVKADISTVRVLSIIHQDELNVQINASSTGAGAAAGFGLLGALVGTAIDASVNDARSKSAEERVEPFRAVMQGTNTTAAINETIEKSVESLDWATANFEVFDDSDNFKVSDSMKGLEEDALLVINSSYALTPELESVEVKSELALYMNKNKQSEESSKKRTKNTRSSHHAAYRSGMKYQSKLYSGRYASNDVIALNEKREALIAEYDEKLARARISKRKELEVRKEKELRKLDSATFSKVEGEVDTQGTIWLQDDGALLRQILEAGVAELGALVSLDLKDPLSPEEYKTSKQKFTTGTMTGGKKTKLVKSSAKGWVLDDSGSRQRIRLQDGFIYSVDKTDFLRPLTPLRR